MSIKVINMYIYILTRVKNKTIATININKFKEIILQSLYLKKNDFKYSKLEKILHPKYKGNRAYK